MTLEEAEALASEVRDDIVRISALRDEIAEVKVLRAPTGDSAPETYHIGVLEIVWHLLDLKEHLPTPTSASHAGWDQVKVRLVAHWSPHGSSNRELR
jgi:hypothetical protein